MIFQPRRREAQRLARTTCLVCFKLKGKHAFVSGEHPSSDLCNCRIECFLCKIDRCNHFVPEGQQQTRCMAMQGLHALASSEGWKPALPVLR